MSDMERNKGKLIPTGIDTENYTDEDFDTLYENGFMLIDGEVYEVEWEVKREDCYDFADVVEHDDGSISFHTYQYNSCGLEDVLHHALKKMDK
jgi:hypothetical protein